MNKRVFFIGVTAVAILYLLGMGVLYFIQERLIFFPQKLSQDHRFTFTEPFEEMNLPMADGVRLNALLFHARQPKGLIYYLHGNAGSLESWGTTASTYTALNYDVLMLDYRGFGKSEGGITSEAQLHSDVSTVYNSLKRRYREGDIIILGYSIGTGPAAKLASETGAGRLILQAPYFNMAGLMKQFYPLFPRAILRYRLETNKYLPRCAMPVAIFHGDRDKVIDYQSALRLKALLKTSDTLITLEGAGHNGMTELPEYRMALRSLLRDTGVQHD